MYLFWLSSSAFQVNTVLHCTEMSEAGKATGHTRNRKYAPPGHQDSPACERRGLRLHENGETQLVAITRLDSMKLPLGVARNHGTTPETTHGDGAISSTPHDVTFLGYRWILLKTAAKVNFPVQHHCEKA